MADTTAERLTVGAIAAELGVSPPKVKKAIDELKIVPIDKKGVCSYYGRDTVAKVQALLKK